MKVLYWIVTLGWYYLMTVIATTYWKGFGWWFLFVCAIVMMIGVHFIRRIFKKD